MCCQTIIEARGRADATFIQMEAEAKGEFEVLDKKAQVSVTAVSTFSAFCRVFTVIVACFLCLSFADEAVATAGSRRAGRLLRRCRRGLQAVDAGAR